MKKSLEVIFAILFSISSIIINAQQVTTDWVINNFPGYPVGVMIGLDQSNNVFVTGQLGDHTNIITTKYNTNGSVIWQRIYSIPELAVVATWLSVDNSGNVIVTGYPHNFSSNPVESGLLTLKYDNNGNLLWDKLITGTWAFAVRSIVDPSGNIYVTGRAWQYTATYDFVTVKYAPDGTQLWFDTFDQNSGFHTPVGMDLDQTGNLFITGSGQSGGLITAMYNNAGARQWVREHSGTSGNNIKVNNGGVFITGSFYDYNTGTSNDVMLLKYNLSGNLVLEKFYDFGNSEYGKLVNIDSYNNIFVTGFGALQGQFPGWLIIKLDSSGNIIWFNRFKANQAWQEFPYFTLTGPQDEIYVTGNVGVNSGGTTYHGLQTVRYNSDGYNQWIADVNQYAGIGKGLALGSDLSLYVVGQFYYSVIKYSQTATLNLYLTGLLEGFYDNTTNTMIRDTVRVYLRNASSPFANVDSSKAVLDQNGNGSFEFTNSNNGVAYYIVVKHRNSIETWSSSVNSFISNELTYDFSTSSSMAFGNNMKLKGSRWTFFGGDVNHDGIVDLSDLTKIFNDGASFVSGYSITDVTGDNFVDLSDLLFAFENSRNFVRVMKP